MAGRRNVDGIGLLRAEFMMAQIGEHPQKMIADKRQKEYIEKLFGDHDKAIGRAEILIDLAGKHQLTDEEVAKLRERIVKRLEQELGAKLRT